MSNISRLITMSGSGEVLGPIVYVSDYTNSVINVYNVNIPDKPKLISSFQHANLVSPGAMSLDSTTNRLYVVTNSYSVMIIDVTDPKNLTEINTFVLISSSTAISGMDFDVNTKNLYAVNYAVDKFYGFNLSDPFTKITLGTYSSGTFLNYPKLVKIDSTSTYAYVGVAQGVTKLNISNPSSVGFVTRIASGVSTDISTRMKLDETNGRLYRTSYQIDKMFVYGISAPSSITLLGEIYDASALNQISSVDVDTNTNTAFVWGFSNMDVIDASTPSSMSIIGTGPYNVWGPLVYDQARKFVYMGRSGLTAFDVSDTTNPVVTYQVGGSGGTDIIFHEYYP